MSTARLWFDVLFYSAFCIVGVFVVWCLLPALVPARFYVSQFSLAAAITAFVLFWEVFMIRWIWSCVIELHRRSISKS